MQRVYRQSNFAKAYALILLIAAILGLINCAADHDIHGIYFMLAAIIAFIWLSAGTFIAKITIDDNHITVDSGKLGPYRDLTWNEIGRVADISYSGFHVYHLLPTTPGKLRIMIPFSIAKKKDLLREVVQRTPHAIIDKSIRRMLGHGLDDV